MVNKANYYNLCISLLHCDTEKEVELLLKENHLIDDSLWKPLGDSLANYSIAGNQQSSPVAALVEKLVNSIDAVLIDECWRNGINPKSSHAPNTMREAVEKFFQIPDGKLENIDSKRRTSLAQRIQMIATGKEGKDPSYTIIDNGEGQTPSMMPQTILSLPGKQEASKSKIKFVQGLFNMGGTGVLRFSGQNSYSQLIISRRDPDLLGPESKEEDKMWGFTIIRRKNPTESRESSIYEYLAPNGDLLKFQSKNIPVLPGSFPNKYENPLYWGTCIKLYEYAMSPRSFASHIVLDLNYELSRHFQEMAVPIRLVERRREKASRSNTKEGTLAGMSVRLQDDHASNLLEKGYPFDAFIKIDEVGRIPIKVYVFNTKARDSLKRYIGDKAIIFTINGQMHGHLKKTLFSRSEVNLSYIADFIMLVLDCSLIDPRARERLFMASRDRLEDGRIKTAIEQALVDLLKHNDALQTLAEKRRDELMRKAFEDSEPLKDAINKWIKTSPDIASLFPEGMEVTKESGFKYIKTNENYKGKKFPTFFRLKDGKNELIIDCPINSYCNIVYETDANNNYFTRSRDKGTFALSTRANQDMVKSFSLFNGIFRLQLKPPFDAKKGDNINITSIVSDKTQPKKFQSKIRLQIRDPIVKTKSKSPMIKKTPIIWGRSKQSIENGEGNTSGLQLPNATWIGKEDEAWESHGFNDYTGLKLLTLSNNFDLLINKDNIYLKNQINLNKTLPADLIKEEYKWGMTIACMGIYFHQCKKLQRRNDEKENQTDTENLSETVSEICDGLAPIILPIISLNEVIRKEKEILIRR